MAHEWDTNGASPGCVSIERVWTTDRTDQRGWASCTLFCLSVPSEISVVLHRHGSEFEKRGIFEDSREILTVQFVRFLCVLRDLCGLTFRPQATREGRGEQENVEVRRDSKGGHVPMDGLPLENASEPLTAGACPSRLSTECGVRRIM